MENDKREIPIKGIYYKTLNFALDQNLPSSGHAVSKISFVDFDGTEKCGFYKPISEQSGYPELLALISVAGSVYLRLALGDRAAEERLVFNEKNEITGTVSINLEKFIPLTSSIPLLSFLKKEEKNKEYTIPSTHALLEHNIALLLVAMWQIKNDDLHPGNISLFGVIDFDMIWYNLTHIIKGIRWSSGKFTELPKKGLELKWGDIDNFPCVDERTHWPTYVYPNNVNVDKRYPSYQSFIDLASNPVCETETQGHISFEQQKFEAMLQHLLAYDPDMLRARLTDYIGTLPLDYLNESKLPKEKASQLSQFNKELFNTETNTAPFIEMMLAFIQKEYDEFYCTIVTYPGCEKNNKGVKVSPFHHFLRTNPQSFHTIINRMKEENEHILKTHKNYNGDIKHILFNLEKTEKRYLQILRDSHLFIYNGILNQFEDLIYEIAMELEISQHLIIKKNSFIQLNKTLTESSQLISKKNIELNPLEKTIVPNNTMALGLQNLIAYVNHLYDICIQYISLPRETLKIEEHGHFCVKIIQNQCGENAQLIQKHLDQTTFAETFSHLQKKLETLTFAFKMYDMESNHNIQYGSGSKNNVINVVLPKHTSQKVIETCVATLFDWAKSIELTLLTSTILHVVNNDYTVSTLNFLAVREREEPVKIYLKTAETLKTPGDIVLADILSSGERKSTSLNTKIVKYLIPFMLNNLGSKQLNVNLRSVLKAIHDNKFNVTQYTNAICDAAILRNTSISILKPHPENTSKIEQRPSSKITNNNNNKKNPEPSSTKTNIIYDLEQFINMMYQWVNSIPKERFYKIVEHALNAYDKPKSKGFFQNVFSNKTRREPVTLLLEKLKNEPTETNARILALIFTNGETNDNSLNTILFQCIQIAMFNDATKNNDNKLKEQKGFQTLTEMKWNKLLLTKCLQALSALSKPWTYPQHTLNKQPEILLSHI